MSIGFLRSPAVSGQFYPSSNRELQQEIKKLIDPNAVRLDAFGCIMPHAGYIYSGRIAGKTISHIKLKDTVILLGPNHTGYGAPFEIMNTGVWKTPIGESKINSELAEAILENSENLIDDRKAHLYEHSLEVQLPFLQYLKPDIKIVPIVGITGQPAVYKEIGRSIAKALVDCNMEKSVLIIASSDMTHYEPQESAQKKDNAAIEAILELDETKLLKKINDLNITMCGYVPIAIMLTAVKLLGAKKAELVEYQTSGDVSGDYTSVVGYAGIIIK